MPAGHAQKIRIASRRAKVAHLMLTEPNLSCRQMAHRLGMESKRADATIWNDRNAIEEEWKQSSLVAFDKAKGIQLARLEKVYDELWKEWERSKKTKTASGKSIKKRLAEIKAKGKKAKAKMVPESEDTFTKKEDGLGDPRYMKLLMENVQMQCDLFGISIKNKDELTSTPQIVAFNIVVPESMAPAMANQPKQIEMVDSSNGQNPQETSNQETSNQEQALFDTGKDEDNGPSDKPSNNGLNSGNGENDQGQADSGDQEGYGPNW